MAGGEVFPAFFRIEQGEAAIDDAGFGSSTQGVELRNAHDGREDRHGFVPFMVLTAGAAAYIVRPLNFLSVGLKTVMALDIRRGRLS